MPDQDQFLLAPPPRAVPGLLRAQVLFGGFSGVFGWALFGFGMIFFWAFALNADLASFYYFRGELQTAPAVVLESWKTRASEGGSKTRKGTPIYAHRYSFTGPDGLRYEGVSYALGRQLPEGQDVDVEFPAGRPALSRIQGMRRALFGPWVIFVVVFPFIGLCFLAAALAAGVRANRLLARGHLAWGTLKAKNPTNTRINRRTVYRLRFEFTADDGQTYRAIARTHEPERLEDEARERLLYDPYRPSAAVLLDSLPGSPAIAPDGNFRVAHPGRAWLAILLPAATLLGHGAYVLWKFF